jgi:hypothetical protein
MMTAMVAITTISKTLTKGGWDNGTILHVDRVDGICNGFNNIYNAE